MLKSGAQERHARRPHTGRTVVRLDAPKTRDHGGRGDPEGGKPEVSPLKAWAHLGSNQGPPACEAGALPLSYAPGRNRGAWKECLALLPPGPDAVHTLPPPRPVDGTSGFPPPLLRFCVDGRRQESSDAVPTQCPARHRPGH